MVGMKGFELWAHGFAYYEQLKAMDDISHSRSWVQCFKCYKQLWVVVDMNDSELWAQALNVINSLGLWKTQGTLGR